MSKGNEVFSMRLKSLRLAHGISQRNLGILAGIEDSVASTRINRYEQAVHGADYSIAQQLGKVLDAPVSYFYTEQDDLAELILEFHRASQKKKREFIRILNDLPH